MYSRLKKILSFVIFSNQLSVFYNIQIDNQKLKILITQFNYGKNFDTILNNQLLNINCFAAEHQLFETFSHRARSCNCFLDNRSYTKKIIFLIEGQ